MKNLNENRDSIVYDKAKKKKVKWLCDKNHCKSLNIRIIPIESIINDDSCSFCLQKIHEPFTNTKI